MSVLSSSFCLASEAVYQAELPLKSASNPWGAWYEQETCDKFADIAQYIYSTFEPVDDFKLQTRSKKYAAEIIQFITETLDSQASTVVSN